MKNIYIYDVYEALTLVDFDEDDEVRVYFPDMASCWEMWSRDKLRERMEETNSIRVITEGYLNEYCLEIQIKDYPYPVAFIPTIKSRVREVLQRIQEYALENEEDEHKMTELTMKSIADKYDLLEDTVEEIFMHYDTNDFKSVKSVLNRIGFENPKLTTQEFVSFVVDILEYIHDNSQPQYEIENKLMKDPEEETEILSLEEAVYDYKQRMEDYDKQRSKIDEQKTNDEHVLIAVLSAHFEIDGLDTIDILGNKIILCFENSKLDDDRMRKIQCMGHEYTVYYDGVLCVDIHLDKPLEDVEE